MNGTSEEGSAALGNSNTIVESRARAMAVLLFWTSRYHKKIDDQIAALATTGEVDSSNPTNLRDSLRKVLQVIYCPP